MQTLNQEEKTSLSYEFRLTKPTYEEAKSICRKAGITSYAQYTAFARENRNFKLPSYPSQSYKEWTSIYDFLGTVPRNNREWALYERSLKIKSGELVVERKPKVKTKASEPKPVQQKLSFNSVDEAQQQVLELLKSGADFRALFVKMTKHYDVFEECKGAIRSLYTMDELLDKI